MCHQRQRWHWKRRAEQSRRCASTWWGWTFSGSYSQQCWPGLYALNNWLKAFTARCLDLPWRISLYHSLVVTVIFRLTYVIRVVVFVLQNNRRKAERRISVNSAIGYPTSRSFVTVFHDNVQFAAYPQIGSPEGLRVTPFRASFVSWNGWESHISQDTQNFLLYIK